MMINGKDKALFFFCGLSQPDSRSAAITANLQYRPHDCRFQRPLIESEALPVRQEASDIIMGRLGHY
jgi:hypothetical protein